MRQGFVVANISEENDQSNAHSHKYPDKAGYIVVTPNYATGFFNKTKQFIPAIENNQVHVSVLVSGIIISQDSDEFDDIQAQLIKEQKSIMVTGEEIVLEAKKKVFAVIVAEMKKTCELHRGNYCFFRILEDKNYENRFWRMEVHFSVIITL